MKLTISRATGATGAAGSPGQGGGSSSSSNSGSSGTSSGSDTGAGQGAGADDDGGAGSNAGSGAGAQGAGNANANNNGAAQGNAQGNAQGATGNVAISATSPNTPSRLGAINTVGQILQAAPLDFNTAEGAVPQIDDLFNFNDGTSFDLQQGGLVPGSTRASQAREINSRIPTSIQFAFRRGDINYYDPGNGQFYYIRSCSAGHCNILQVDRRTNSYRSANDGQIHWINIDFPRSTINLFTNDGMASGGIPHQIQQGDTFDNIAARFGMSPSMLLAANPGANGNNIVVGNTLRIPALVFTASAGDTLPSIALDTGADREILNALNPEIRAADAINAEQRIRVPPSVPNLPLAFTVQDGQSLPIISNLLGLEQSSLDNLNPGLDNLGVSATGHIAAIPNFVTSTGDVKFTDTTTNPFANGLGDFNKRDVFATITGRMHPRQVARRAIAA